MANDAYQTQRLSFNGLVYGIMTRSASTHCDSAAAPTKPEWVTQRQTFLTIITILDAAYGTATATT